MIDFKSLKPGHSRFDAQRNLMERFIVNANRKGFAVERISDITDQAKAESIAESFRLEGVKVRSLQNENGEWEVVAAFGPDTRVQQMVQSKR